MDCELNRSTSKVCTDGRIGVNDLCQIVRASGVGVSNKMKFNDVIKFVATSVIPCEVWFKIILYIRALYIYSHSSRMPAIPDWK